MKVTKCFVHRREKPTFRREGKKKGDKYKNIIEVLK